MVIDEEELVIGRFLDAEGNIPTHEEELSFMRRHVREGDVVVDVGANAGFFTLALAGMVGPIGQVLAIEPNLDVLRNLQRTQMDRSLTQIVSFLGALGKEHCWASMRGDPRGPGGTQVIPDREEGIVYLTTLDLLAKDESLHRPISFIKIDTEGMDVDVLWGARGILEKDRPVIMFEWNPEAISSLGKSPTDEGISLGGMLLTCDYGLLDLREQPGPNCTHLEPGDYALIPQKYARHDVR
jgi:FkbM family methyltransferase